MDLITSLEFWDRAGVVAVLIVVALLVITDKLVWHKRLEAAESRADRWEKVALASLSGGTKAGVAAAETAAAIVAAMPDPVKEGLR